MKCYSLQSISCPIAGQENMFLWIRLYETAWQICWFMLACILYIVQAANNYTVSQKKLRHFYFYCNFGKFWSIFKILSMSESERNGS